jgi:hypothetical protein
MLSKRDQYALARTKELFEALKWDDLEYLGLTGCEHTNKAGQVLAHSLVHIDEELQKAGMGINGQDWGKLVVLSGLAIIAAHKDKADRMAAN